MHNDLRGEGPGVASVQLIPERNLLEKVRLVTERKESCQHLGRTFQGASRAKCSALRLGGTLLGKEHSGEPGRV